MKTALAFAILALVFVVIAVIVASEHPTPMAMGMVQTAAPEARANMLFSPCPLTPSNVPPLQRDRIA